MHGTIVLVYSKLSLVSFHRHRHTETYLQTTSGKFPTVVEPVQSLYCTRAPQFQLAQCGSDSMVT